jgi:hypothetical protein
VGDTYQWEDQSQFNSRDTVRKRFSLIVLALTFLFNALPLFARLARPWSLQKMFDKADLVVVATFLSTQDTQERSSLQDVDPALKVIGFDYRV